MTTIHVEAYDEQESYWKTLATNMAIRRLRDEWYSADSQIRWERITRHEDVIQWLEHKLAWIEYQQWCLLNDLPYTVYYPYGE